MRWTYSFWVSAGVAEIYRLATPGVWMSFYLPQYYRGVERVDDGWPRAGASIVLRYQFGPLPLRIHQTVTHHVPGRVIRIREEVLRGVWQDRNDIVMKPRKDGTTIIVVSDQTSRYWPLRLLAPIRWLTNWLDIAPALHRFAAMVEAK